MSSSHRFAQVRVDSAVRRRWLVREDGDAVDGLLSTGIGALPKSKLIVSNVSHCIEPSLVLTVSCVAVHVASMEPRVITRGDILVGGRCVWWCEGRHFQGYSLVLQELFARSISFEGSYYPCDLEL